MLVDRPGTRVLRYPIYVLQQETRFRCCLYSSHRASTGIRPISFHLGSRKTVSSRGFQAAQGIYPVFHCSVRCSFSPTLQIGRRGTYTPISLGTDSGAFLTLNSLIDYIHWCRQGGTIFPEYFLFRNFIKASLMRLILLYMYI